MAPPDLLAGSELAAYAVLEEPGREDLVGVVELAASICDVPMSSINLFADGQQHQVATLGMDPLVCSIEDSMCGVVLRDTPPIVVVDALLDERFRTNPFVDGTLGRIRFYASHQLLTPDGQTIGTLCVYDERPRELTQTQLRALGTLAARVVDALELTAMNHRLSDSIHELEHAQTALEAANERLAAFAGQISHDLKSPLTAMVLALDLLADLEPEDPAIPRVLARARSSSARMAALVDDVLQFATLGGTIAQPTAVAGLMDAVTDDLAAELSGVQVTVDDVPDVLADPEQLRSVVQNLLSNAAKFRSPDRAPQVRVAGRRVGSRVRVMVTDNGRGIEPAALGTVFDPLVRADHTTAGHGIGLATCRRLIEANHGAIGLDSTLDVGTSVWFELPAG